MKGDLLAASGGIQKGTPGPDGTPTPTSFPYFSDKKVVDHWSPL